jgi:hypothetical protein
MVDVPEVHLRPIDLGTAKTTMISVMMIIPAAANSANAAECLGPSRLNAPSPRIAQIAHSAGLVQFQAMRRRACVPPPSPPW